MFSCTWAKSNHCCSIKSLLPLDQGQFQPSSEVDIVTFCPQGQSHPSLKGDLRSSVQSHAPLCFSSAKRVAQRETVGSPLTPNMSPSCQYNGSWESCWPRIGCQGEVAGGEKCQQYCFPAGSGNSLCLCPSALRSKPPWIIQVLFENSHHAESEGSLALPAGKQALIVSSRAKPRLLCSHNDSSSFHLSGRVLSSCYTRFLYICLKCVGLQSLQASVGTLHLIQPSLAVLILPSPVCWACRNTCA